MLAIRLDRFLSPARCLGSLESPYTDGNLRKPRSLASHFRVQGGLPFGNAICRVAHHVWHCYLVLSNVGSAIYGLHYFRNTGSAADNRILTANGIWGAANH